MLHSTDLVSSSLVMICNPLTSNECQIRETHMHTRHLHHPTLASLPPLLFFCGFCYFDIAKLYCNDHLNQSLHSDFIVIAQKLEHKDEYLLYVQLPSGNTSSTIQQMGLFFLFFLSE